MLMTLQVSICIMDLFLILYTFAWLPTLVMRFFEPFDHLRSSTNWWPNALLCTTSSLVLGDTFEVSSCLLTWQTLRSYIVSLNENIWSKPIQEPFFYSLPWTKRFVVLCIIILIERYCRRFILLSICTICGISNQNSNRYSNDTGVVPSRVLSWLTVVYLVRPYSQLFYIDVENFFPAIGMGWGLSLPVCLVPNANEPLLSSHVRAITTSIIFF